MGGGGGGWGRERVVQLGECVIKLEAKQMARGEGAHEKYKDTQTKKPSDEKHETHERI